MTVETFRDILEFLVGRTFLSVTRSGHTNLVVTTSDESKFQISLVRLEPNDR
jgi:hypothetical protein